MDIRIWDSEVRGKIQEWSKLYLLKYNTRPSHKIHLQKLLFLYMCCLPQENLTIFVEMKSKQIIVKTIKKSEIKNTNKCRL